MNTKPLAILTSCLILTLTTACGSSPSSNTEELESLRAENEALKESIYSMQNTTEDVTTADSESGQNIGTTTAEEISTINTNTNTNTYTVWKKKYFVDDWGDPDYSAPYLSTLVDNGNFSDSATVNSDLFVQVIASQDYVSLVLYKYGYSSVVGGSKGKSFDIKLYGDNNNEISLSGHLESNGEQILICDEQGNISYIPINMLRNNGTLKFIVTENSKYSKDEYRFKLDCTGFDSSYNQMLEEIS